MNVKAEVDRQLQQLDRRPLTDRGTWGIDVVSDEGHLEAELSAVNELACAVDRIRYRSRRLADAPLDQLRHACEELAGRLNYLLEPLSTVECDSQAEVVQMRSSPPHRENQSVAYYELTAQRGGTITLQRYQKSRGESRRVVPANFTRETFGRLARDLAAI